uniref:glutathione S-transferase n=1 Tax=Orrella sp. TaxID=1921583 RepID=UPI0040470840
MSTQLPVLYSYRRCPYAMRARMALRVAQVTVSTVEIDLRDKPADLVAASPKATVPVLCLGDGKILDESLDIVRWALTIRDPDDWARGWEDSAAMDLLARTDGDFKRWLDRYKYATRFPVSEPTAARAAAFEVLIEPLSLQLQNKPFIGGETPMVQDVLIFPFVRQFAGVDPVWFKSNASQSVQNWLAFWVDSPLFKQIMLKSEPPTAC